jgi:hypothetical protein
MRELENFRKYLTEEQPSEQEAAFDKEFLNAADDIAGALEKELKSKKPEQLKEEIILATISTILTANAVIGFVSKYAAKLAKLLNWKKGEDFAEKVHHWAHDNEKAFQAPIKRILSLFIKDAKALDIMTKATYALIVGGMAANYGIEAVNQLSNSSWFSGALTALKTVAKGDETIVNAYPALKALFT